MAIRSLAGDDTPIIRGKWPLVFAVITGICTILYFIYVSKDEPEGGTAFGILFGVMALLLMLFLIAYKIRKHAYGYKLGPTNTWLTAHIYLGVLAAILVILHTGLNIDGVFGGVLFALFVLVTGSGIAGALVYKLTPISITKEGRQVILKEDMREELNKHLADADKDAAALSAAFQEIYREKIRPMLTYNRVAWEYLFTEERALLRLRTKEMDELKQQVPDNEKYHFTLMTGAILERERLAFRLSKMEVLDVWLAFHMPLSGVTLTAVFIHIFAIFYYW
ncbi:MAG: hypothetical protein HZA04_06250 [Nitrospinae bacterium]|nr:hypothetical protein [Nitrospinota bacterium]